MFEHKLTHVSQREAGEAEGANVMVEGFVNGSECHKTVLEVSTALVFAIF